ncbi:hypothetical protein EJ04DRAFT_94718 [Polyplosphaeria fusca]|uniref:Uncharacterized protein n=1 Tax=Polyplosphaeria fusca TaxID=682080 RepID=A0A9P4R2U3_9PLEO|nr:hypothetical protein EJ04DRAFT_94718 [Polyplosphaeria fusca]
MGSSDTDVQSARQTARTRPFSIEYEDPLREESKVPPGTNKGPRKNKSTCPNCSREDRKCQACGSCYRNWCLPDQATLMEQIVEHMLQEFPSLSEVSKARAASSLETRTKFGQAAWTRAPTRTLPAHSGSSDDSIIQHGNYAASSSRTGSLWIRRASEGDSDHSSIATSRYDPLDQDFFASRDQLQRELRSQRLALAEVKDENVTLRQQLEASVDSKVTETLQDAMKLNDIPKARVCGEVERGDTSEKCSQSSSQKGRILVRSLIRTLHYLARKLASEEERKSLGDNKLEGFVDPDTYRKFQSSVHGQSEGVDTLKALERAESENLRLQERIQQINAQFEKYSALNEWNETLCEQQRSLVAEEQAVAQRVDEARRIQEMLSKIAEELDDHLLSWWQDDSQWDQNDSDNIDPKIARYSDLQLLIEKLRAISTVA